jgi:hypothetical protein
VLRHKGKYQCNINHKNSHFLNVHPSPRTYENTKEQEEDKLALFESENDHEDQRLRFEPSIEEDQFLESTVITFTEKVTETAAFSSANIDTIPDFDEEKSHEKFVDEPITYEDFSSPREFDVTASISFTTISSSLPSLTNIPSIHSTHATTHKIYPTNKPSEAVITQTHLKGSQK